jgi:hypothetical protein
MSRTMRLAVFLQVLSLGIYLGPSRAGADSSPNDECKQETLGHLWCSACYVYHPLPKWAAHKWKCVDEGESTYQWLHVESFEGDEEGCLEFISECDAGGGGVN